MDVELYYWLLIGGAAVSAVTVVIWMVFFVWLGKLIMQQREKALSQMFSQLDETLRPLSPGGFSQLGSPQQGQVMQMLMKFQTQFNQLNDLGKQRHELTVSQLSGMAANAGISWTPPS